ncbi:MAG: hypothetical protein JHC54_12005 [Acinetobacter sp.]|nr:hypothetical protein [Acinetobacter sp.]
MPQPLVDSRSLAVDLTMTVDQTIERMRMIVQKMPIEDASGNAMNVSPEDRTAVVDFLEEHKNNIREGKLNARTIGNLAKIKLSADKSGKDWKKQATVMLYS